MTLQTCTSENFRSRQWGAEWRVKHAQSRERGPPSAWAEIKNGCGPALGKPVHHNIETYLWLLFCNWQYKKRIHPKAMFNLSSFDEPMVFILKASKHTLWPLTAPGWNLFHQVKDTSLKEDKIKRKYWHTKTSTIRTLGVQSSSFMY